MPSKVLKHIFTDKKNQTSQQDLPKINLTIVAFEDDCLNNSGQILAQHLKLIPIFSVCYYDENFNKNFLDLQSRNFFDFTDAGKKILKKTDADILIWGYREQDKIRINFQTSTQYEKQSSLFFSLLNSLYLPLEYFQENKLNPPILNLIHATILTAIGQSKYNLILQQALTKINKYTPPKDISIDYLPYLLNLLALAYLSSVKHNLKKQNIKIVSAILKNALNYPKKENKSILNGLIYANFGQLYQLAAEQIDDDKYTNCKFAVDFYSLAQKFFPRNTFPYDYGNIAYRLSKLYFIYWKYTSDIQFLRNAVFELREAQKVFTQIVFPKIWITIQKDLGLYLSMMAVFSRNFEIAKIAIENYKNCQYIYNKQNAPLEWAHIQENIGNIYFECAKFLNNEEYFEVAARYYIDSFNIYQEYKQDDSIKRINISITKADKYIFNLSNI